MCNLRCKYCFYGDVSQKREIKNYGVMDEKTLECLVRQAFLEAKHSVCFAFQGGEPTLAGLDFYRKLIEYQKKYNQNHLPVQNSIQTNGIVIDDAWAKFFAKHHFLAGLSMDGYKETHDCFRVDARGEGTFQKVQQAAKILEKNGAEFNLLCVVTNQIARHALKVYRFFKKSGFRYLQLIPCLDDFDTERNGEHMLSPQRYAEFLKIIFDQYYQDFMNRDYMSIRLFDNYVSMLMGMPPESCGLSGVCSCNFVVEADGSVYPCDFYVLDSYRLGNIHQNTFGEMRTSENAERFVKESASIDERCKKCKWFPICRGGCRRNREPFSSGKPMLNFYCESFYDFFEYSIARMQKMAAVVMQSR